MDLLNFSNSNTQQSNYKFEHGGLLVYDLKGEITAAPTKYSPPDDLPPKFTAQDLRDLHKNKHLDSSKTAFLKSYPPCPHFPILYTYQIPKDKVTLEFNSRFESGNLSKAIKMSDYDYKLYISNDIGTYNCNHWFYFSAKNPRKTRITFKIVNMRKKDVLFQAGMKPAVYSTQTEKHQGTKWLRDCSNVCYYENLNNRSSSHKSYTLSFTYSFKYEQDTVYFAYAVPYTYSDLQDSIELLETCYPDTVRIDTICETLAGNKCQLLTLTDSVSDYLSFNTEKKLWNCSENNRPKMLPKILADAKKNEGFNEEKHKQKLGLVLMARVHSGETVSSYMLKGAIDYLTSPSGKSLRKNFVFKIVPMLNPDGVRYGSYRNSLLGVDLNRRWHKPHKVLHPTIFHSKVMIKTFNLINEVKMICDMHGHTKKLSAFMYGCCKIAENIYDSQQNLKAKSIPYLFSTNNKFFSMKNSHFRIENYKNTTARIVLFNNLCLPHSYTLESSFYGHQEGKKIKQFSECDLENIGKTLCKICNSFTPTTRYLESLLKTNEYLRSIMYDCPKLTMRKTLSKIENLPNDKIEDNLSVNSEENSPIVEESCSEILEFEMYGNEEDWWNRIDIVEIQPDSDSSGSESEISDFETQAVKSPVNNIQQNLSARLSPPKSVKVKQSSLKPSKRSKISLKTRKTKNPESLNLNIFNFSIDFIEQPARRSFEATKIVNKNKEKKEKEGGRNSFLLPVLKSSKIKTKVTNLAARKEFSAVINEAARIIQSSSHFQGKTRYTSV